MEHLNTIQKFSIQAPRIPFFGNDECKYDNDGFFDYPYRCGVRKDKSKPGLFGMETKGMGVDDMAPFLQAWLFFGTLHELFSNIARTDFDANDFISHEEHGCSYITTERLPMSVRC